MGRTVHAVRVYDESWAGADFEANDVLPTRVRVVLDNGERALYIDGAALRADNARLQAEVELLQGVVEAARRIVIAWGVTHWVEPEVKAIKQALAALEVGK